MIETIDAIDMIDWVDTLIRSHRWQHLVCGFLVGLVFGFGAALVAAGALEFKDCQHDGYNARRGVQEWRWKAWDWWDFGCTVVGGVIGFVGRIGIFSLFGII